MGIVKNINIATEMKKSFLDYAMSVIVSRALPDVRDGLKPVHRRIIYSMHDLGMYSDKAYKKSARIVGEVIGKYHPHGDTSIYDAMVRMAQDFSIRYMLVQGHGNFGSIDGDSPAAMRYTEARMSKICMWMVKDIKKDTVAFRENYDASESEPVVLPSRIPNLLLNGTTGIAVGMATTIAPHNINEIIDGITAFIDNQEISIPELMEIIKGPDFPTGGIILGRSGIKNAFETGKGSIAVRGRCEIKDISKSKQAIIVTEIPYQVQKSKLVTKIADLAKDKKIEGITDLRDESNREGIKIVIELRSDANANIILNNLYKQTQLQSNFSVNNLSLVNNEPKLLSLKETIHYYVEHQVEIIERRTKFDLAKFLERVHILDGLLIALDNIDRVIKLIRSSQTDLEAINQLQTEFKLTEIQAKAILDMRLRRLTGLERDKIEDEVNDIRKQIEILEGILADKNKIYNIIKEELAEAKHLFGDERRTEIDDSAIDFIDDESLIPQEDIMILLSNSGYIKRTTTDQYRVQNRGGVGLKGMKTNEDDYVDIVLSTNTHSNVLFFTNYGKVYRVKGYEIPNFSRTAKGTPVVNLLPIEKDETINAIVPVEAFDQGGNLCFATKKGLIKKTPISEYESIRKTGKIAVSLREEDELIAVRLTSGSDSIIMGASNGKSILFEESSIRESGRKSSGVRGIKLDDEDSCVGMAVAQVGMEVLVISENGYGKRTPIEKYRYQSRGGKGSRTIKTATRNGKLVSLRTVTGDEDIFVISNEGMLIRTTVSQISVTGRDTMGVRIINLKENEIVSNVAVVSSEIKEELEEEN